MGFNEYAVGYVMKARQEQVQKRANQFGVLVGDEEERPLKGRWFQTLVAKLIP